MRAVGAKHLGSIPACAGEPRSLCVQRSPVTVYPRVCGGTPAGARPGLRRAGLSPRVRGNPSLFGDTSSRPRSIPACAGEPPPTMTQSMPSRVYPRVCGGTECVVTAKPFRYGLSPRVRGNPRAHAAKLAGLRSIPACAGEPIICAKRPRR